MMLNRKDEQVPGFTNHLSWQRLHSEHGSEENIYASSRDWSFFIEKEDDDDIPYLLTARYYTTEVAELGWFISIEAAKKEALRRNLKAALAYRRAFE